MGKRPDGPKERRREDSMTRRREPQKLRREQSPAWRKKAKKVPPPRKRQNQVSQEVRGREEMGATMATSKGANAESVEQYRRTDSDPGTRTMNTAWGLVTGPGKNCWTGY
uniref:NP1 n=2 Tax=Caenorhabditis tropicalis TaxID=1561998 RepID=A0A1I7TT84_9PELO